MLVLAMEYVQGEDLDALVKSRGPLPVLNACLYAWQVANGLQYAHENETVHRDIKPANLILLRQGKRHSVKILDFGLAKVTSENAMQADLTAAGQMMGTPLYMAPEQALDAAAADIRADIYSLGCTLFFLLTGKPPFSGGALEVLRKHREEEPPRPQELRPEMPDALVGVVSKMMAKNPALRYQTPAEVAKALAPHLRRSVKRLSAEVVSSVVAQSTVDKKSTAEFSAPPQEVWGELGLSDLPAPAVSKPTTTRRRRPLSKWSAVVGAFVIAVVTAWAGGALRVKTPEGTIVLENVPEDADVHVDGKRVTITRNGDAVTIQAVAGNRYPLKVVRKNGEMLLLRDVEV
jgi:serine/threonine protein kinase